MSALVLMLLAASPSVVVVPESDAARAAAATLTTSLQELKLAARAGAPACSGLEGDKRRACAAQAAAGADAVVLVSVADVRGRLAVAIEVIARRGTKLLFEDAVRGADAAALKPAAVKIADAVRALPPPPVSQPRPQPKPGDSKVARLGDPEPDEATPAQPPPSQAGRALAELPKAAEVQPLPAMPAADQTMQPVRSRAPALLAAGALMVCLGASVGLGLFAGSQQARLNENEGGVSPLRYSDAEKLSGSINLLSGASYGFGIAAAALLAVTLWLLLRA